MVIFGLGGVGLIGLAIRTFLLRLSRRHSLIRVTGIITEVRQKRFHQTGTQKVEIMWHAGSGRSRRSSIQYFPVIAFRNRAGDLITFQSAHGDNGQNSQYEVDAEIDVFYDPAGEMEQIIASWMAMWGEPLLLAFSGLVFIGGSALIWYAFGDRILGL